jgi:hypothetical protein
MPSPYDLLDKLERQKCWEALLSNLGLLCPPLDRYGANLPVPYSLLFFLQGLDTEHPILQIDHMLFEGSFVETIGTHILMSQGT